MVWPPTGGIIPSNRCLPKWYLSNYHCLPSCKCLPTASVSATSKRLWPACCTYYLCTATCGVCWTANGSQCYTTQRQCCPGMAILFVLLLANWHCCHHQLPPGDGADATWRLPWCTAGIQPSQTVLSYINWHWRGKLRAWRGAADNLHVCVRLRSFKQKLLGQNRRERVNGGFGIAVGRFRITLHEYCFKVGCCIESALGLG